MRRRRNPTKTPESGGMSTGGYVALGVGVLGLLWLAGGGSEQSGDRTQPQPQPAPPPRPQPGGIQTGPQDTTAAVSRLRPPAGVMAADEIVARVRENQYRNALTFYIQALPYVFGRTEALPTAETASDRASVIASVIGRLFTDNGLTWDGNYNPNAATMLLKQLKRGGEPRRSLPYSLPPVDAGTVYGLAVTADPSAINIFEPTRSVSA